MVRHRLALAGLLAISACSTTLPTSDLDPSFAKRGGGGTTPVTWTLVDVGDSIYNDVDMSRNRNQACGSCHLPGFGFSQGAALSTGSLGGRTARHAPSAAYASFAPNFALVGAGQDADYQGGLFWDGRAKGGNGSTPIIDQAKGPLVALGEHAFSEVCVLWEINVSKYKAGFESTGSFSLATIPFAKIGDAAAMSTFCHTGTAAIPTIPAGFTSADMANVYLGYDKAARAIAAFESSPKVNRFSSKFDVNRAALTADELAGEALFGGDAGCADCHESAADPVAGRVLFTDWGYHNIGVPRNPNNPKGKDWLDPGLGATVGNTAFNGHFRTVTLRNVGKGSPRFYMHNGVLTSLQQVVHFYNTRDLRRCAAGVTPSKLPVSFADFNPSRPDASPCWPAPDFPNNDLSGKLGNIGLTAAQENQLVLFMRTLTDQ